MNQEKVFWKPVLQGHPILSNVSCVGHLDMITEHVSCYSDTFHVIKNVEIRYHYTKRREKKRRERKKEESMCKLDP